MRDSCFCLLNARALSSTCFPARQQPALQQVSKVFGDFRAVDGIDLKIEPGEIFALLGPNGAGKTTLISCIAGLAKQSSGTIEVFGYDTQKDFRKTRSLVGLVPQEVNFDPFFTPHESLMIQMGYMGVKPDAQWADKLLETFSLSDHRTAYTRHLSGGMKRRLLVAKALVHRPKLLFLDEPTAGVDVELRQELWQEVVRLREQGTTIILTTHYLEEAEQLADRIGVLSKGKLILVEERAQLMSRFSQSKVSLELSETIFGIPEGLPQGTELIDAKQLLVPWKEASELAEIIAKVQQLSVIKHCEIKQTRLEDIFVDLVKKGAQ